ADIYSTGARPAPLNRAERLRRLQRLRTGLRGTANGSDVLRRIGDELLRSLHADPPRAVLVAVGPGLYQIDTPAAAAAHRPLLRVRRTRAANAHANVQ
ncbi:MAG: hypothetical protein KDA41_01680, partial [Planctomycetales bacterium]|nr:hypothetical protein [Planctomycetales bacterium]